jgi:glycogen debranching enzyme
MWREDNVDSIIHVNDQYYILATSSLIDDRTRVLKQGDTFGVFDRYGDIQNVGLGEQGVYHQGTRFLSRLVLTLGKQRPLLLSSNVRDNNALLTIDVSNPDVFVNGEIVIPRGALHLFRSKFFWDGCCHERFRLSNYGLTPVDISLSIAYGADFSDIFEVRGIRREKRGRFLPEIVEKSRVVLPYEGLDRTIRRTVLEFSLEPTIITFSEALYHLRLEPKAEETILLNVRCELNDSKISDLPYDAAFQCSNAELQTIKDQDCYVDTSNEQFNDWLNRSLADLHMMVTSESTGPYPYAGIPWFSTAFGRDGIITALELLWVNPEIAKGVLKFLARTQATELVATQDAEPGKILHEARDGEMADLGEVPFGRYYGSVDSTPLFVLLAGEYYESTADLQLIESIWPNLELALDWIDKYGDIDQDGFVEYFRHSPKGLVHQGWKDSFDSVFHRDGILAEGPIALCEVQGYTYAARVKGAALANLLGKKQLSADLLRKAKAMRKQFHQAFWSDEISMYALALDGKKNRCLVRSSNAGQCLFTGIVDRRYAQIIARALMQQDMFSGWGIRTISERELRYNPMSYHDGSVWPHDNALIAFGFAKYHLRDEALKVLTGLFDASIFFDLNRMPELFCGFERRASEGPTLYPVACSPQAWAAGSLFLLLQACLGMSIHAPQRQLRFTHPALPQSLQQIRIRNLRVGDATVDCLIERYEQDVGLVVTRREGDVEVILVK